MCEIAAKVSLGGFEVHCLSHVHHVGAQCQHDGGLDKPTVDTKSALFLGDEILRIPKARPARGSGQHAESHAQLRCYNGEQW